MPYMRQNLFKIVRKLVHYESLRCSGQSVTCKHFDLLWIVIKGTGSRLNACSLIKLLLSDLLLILSVNNPTYMYLSDLRVYFKVEEYFRVT